MDSQEENKPAKNSFMGLPMHSDHMNVHKDFWNSQDERVFPLKRFGIGWGLNFHGLLKKAQMIK